MSTKQKAQKELRIPTFIDHDFIESKKLSFPAILEKHGVTEIEARNILQPLPRLDLKQYALDYTTENLRAVERGECWPFCPRMQLELTVKSLLKNGCDGLVYRGHRENDGQPNGRRDS